MDVNTSILETENKDYRIKIDNNNGTTYSIIDNDGNSIIEGEYSYIEYLLDEYFIVCNKESKLGVINVTDKTTNISLEFESIQKIEDTKLIQATKQNISTIYAIKGDKVEQIYQMENVIIDEFEDYIKIYNENDEKYFDKNGNELKNTQIFTNNVLFANKQDEKWGFVDKNGNVKVDYIYDSVTEFNEQNFAGVKLNGKWGVINSDGTVIVEPKYEMQNKYKPNFIGEYYKVEYNLLESYYTK